MNILFIGGGRRTSLAERFESQGHVVYGYELENNTPLSFHHAVCQGLRWDDPDIKSDIKRRMDDIKALAIPLQDAAIPILASLDPNGVVCSPRLPASICFDKQKLDVFMLDNFPDYYPAYEYDTGYIIKPRFGFGSHQVIKHKPLVGSNDVMQRLVKGPEYTVDAYFSKFTHTMIGAVPRLRIRVADGEVIESVTCQNPALHNVTKMIGEHLKLSGPVCFQYIISAGHPYLIEINARFGGGATLSLEAGFNMIDMLVTEYGNNVAINTRRSDWKPNVYMRRTLRDYFFHEGEHHENRS